ncbi:MAG: S-methyl-5'-thioinosine phosphorylase [Candidatus Heimdallarchaeaceae archaeon]
MISKIAIIGGSGVYNLFDDVKQVSVTTPYGDVPNIKSWQHETGTVYFLSRHGEQHSTPPHKINYLANIYALYKLGVKRIYATNAVGSIVSHIQPGDFVVPDQIIDFTKTRPLTFYDGQTSIKFSDGTERKGVVHLDNSFPYCAEARSRLICAIRDQGEKVHETGTYVCTEGPRFETAAEIIMFQKLGGTIVGMTTVPEAFLANELKMCYATMCLITNFGAGMQMSITHEEVVELFQKKISVIKKILLNVVNSDLTVS